MAFDLCKMNEPTSKHGKKSAVVVIITGVAIVLITEKVKQKIMSQAFVKEEDEQWLHEIPGTLTALINYLIRENNGIRVYEKRRTVKNGVEVFEMSNGLSYSKDAQGKWQITG